MRLRQLSAVTLLLLQPVLILAVEPEPAIEEALAGFDDDIELDGGTGDPDLDDALMGFGDAAEASEEPALDEVLEGFDDTPVESEPGAMLSSPHRINGSLGVSTVYAYQDQEKLTAGIDYQGLSRLRTRIDMEYEADPVEGWRLHVDSHAWYDWVYDLRNKNYPQAVLDKYRSEVELGELWLRRRLGSWGDLKLGRQIVVWGKSDNLRVTDVLNPLDRREPGLVDIEDLRLPVGMTRLDLYHGAWNLSGILVHEVRYDKNPPYGSAFFSGTAPLPKEVEPSTSLDNTELALALNGSFSRWDISMYLARFFDDRTYVDLSGPVGAERRHARISMAGGAANMALGNWLIKGELAHFRGIRLSGLNQDFNRTDWLLGIEYSGFTDTSVSFELVDRHLHDYQSTQGFPSRDTWQAAFRYQKDFLHDRLHMVLLVSALELSESSGGFSRLSGEYELTDDLNITLGLVLYNEGKHPPVTGIGDNDRLFLDLKWSF